MKTIRLLTILFCVTWFASCSQDDGYAGSETDERVAVSFWAGMGNAAMPESESDDGSRLKISSDGIGWMIGDSIGIFMLREGATGIDGNVVEDADNRCYTAIYNNSYSRFLPELNRHVYYPPNRNVDFIAYYPYKADLDNYTYPVDISDQTDPTALYMMYSNNAIKANKDSGRIELKFHHKLCRIKINLKASGSVTVTDLQQLTTSKVTFQGFPTKTNVNLSTGEVAGGTDRNPFNPIKTFFPPAGVGAQFTAVLVPDGMYSGRRLSIGFTSRTYYLDLSNYDFRSGEEWTIDVVFSSTRSFGTKSGDTGTGGLIIKSCHKEEWR